MNRTHFLVNLKELSLNEPLNYEVRKLLHFNHLRINFCVIIGVD